MRHALCRRSGLCRPDRLKHSVHMTDVDIAHQKLAQDRLGIGRDGRPPLRRVLRVLEALAPHRDVLSCGHLERDGLRARERCGSPRLGSVLDRVNVIIKQLVVLGRLSPGICKTDFAKRPQAHFPSSAAQRIAKDP